MPSRTAASNKAYDTRMEIETVSRDSHKHAWTGDALRPGGYLKAATTEDTKGHGGSLGLGLFVRPSEKIDDNKKLRALGLYSHYQPKDSQPQQSLCAGMEMEKCLSRQPRAFLDRQQAAYRQVSQGGHRRGRKGRGGFLVLACCSRHPGNEPKKLSALSVLCGCRLRTAAATKLVRAN